MGVKRSISLKVIFILISTIFMIMVFFTLFIYFFEKNDSINDLNKMPSQISERISKNLVTPVWSLNQNEINEIIINEMKNKHVLAIKAFIYGGTDIYARVKNNKWEIDIWKNNQKNRWKIKNAYKSIKEEIYFEKEKIGYVEIYVTDFFIKKKLKKLIYIIIVITVGFSIIFLIILFFSLKKIILKPLIKVANSIHEITYGNLEARIMVKGNDEIEQLANDFNIMADSLKNSFSKIGEQKAKIEAYSEQLEEIVYHRTKELQNANEELTKANSAKDLMFSIVAHDLRGPIGVIYSLLEMINELDLNDKELIEIFHDLKISSKNTYHLLDNLLIWAQSQKNEIKLKPEILDLEEVINKCISVVCIMAKNKKISIKLNMTKNIMIFADENMIFTVIRNILQNAIKFSSSNTEIELITKKMEHFIQIEIRDQGVGMKPEKMKRLFKIGIENSTRGTHNEKGTGLGLIICKDFIEKNGGKFWIKSQEGQGSTFFLTIPLTKQ